ncbi:hypothetical protein [Microvirga zambiensis]|uniref:hypothetical protein n=1 Tax=Microvirga zambiensis TaxID=1402137 RepID=UPI00191D98F2|nr:hypothetical protein [Microvirga zambiensis]
MSLARTALRLAVSRDLLADPVIAALCPGRVFDSIMDPPTSKEFRPTITVTSEDDNGEAFDPQNGGIPFDQTVDLVLEIAMVALGKGEGETISIENPVTDRELEAALDLIEHRAVEVITVGEGPALTRKVSRRVTKYKSSRFPDNENGLRLAIRVITLTFDMKGEDQLDATVVPTGPFANLPDPLRTVCQLLPAGTSGAVVCQMISDALPPVGVEFFEGADITMRPDPSAPLPQPTEGEPHAPFVGVDATITQE